MKPRILVVDDDFEVRKSLKQTLEYAGYEVTLAATGEEGVKLVEHDAPDLVFLDIKMPGMDGYEFASTYRERPGKKAPIVIITAAQSAEKAAAEMDACGYLGKPFGVDQLLAKVSTCIAANGG